MAGAEAWAAVWYAANLVEVAVTFLLDLVKRIAFSRLYFFLSTFILFLTRRRFS